MQTIQYYEIMIHERSSTYKCISFVSPPRTCPAVAADRGPVRVLRLPVIPLVGEADGDDVGPRLHGPGEAEERDVVGGVPVRAKVVFVFDCFLNWYLQMDVETKYVSCNI